MPRLLAAVAVLMLLLSPASTQNCTECHVCENPSHEDPCLKECSRETHIPDWHDIDKLHSPDVVILDQLVELYEAVTFDHKAHAEMSGMGGNTCRLCHHENREATIMCCCDCHPAEGVVGEDDLIDLKSAYHRQCMLCHRDWSGEADCEICHLPLDGNGHPVDMVRPEPFSHHRESTAVINFETPHEPAPYVTFHHDKHADTYGISCCECHQQDDCSTCHVGNGNGGFAPIHFFSNKETCGGCHGTGQCGSCHSREPDRDFRHEYTGFPMRSFHADLSCQACHGEQHAHGHLARDCQGCHTSGWGDTDSFDHAGLIGVDLGEEHEAMECGECHPDLGFAATPLCADCHEEEDWGPDLLN